MGYYSNYWRCKKYILARKKCNIRHLSCKKDSVGACGLSVDGTTRHLIKTDLNRAVTTLPSASTHSQIGQLYSVLLNIRSAENEIRQILFNNNSNRTMYLDKIICSSIVIPEDTPRNYTESVQITIIKIVSITNPGTPLTPTNLNTAFPDASSILVSLNPSAISGTIIFSVRPLGEYVSIDFEGRIVVPPNTNIIVQFLLNNPPTGLSVDFWSTLIWYEL